MSDNITALPVRVEVSGSTIAAFESFAEAAYYVEHLSPAHTGLDRCEISIHFRIEAI